MSKSEYAVKEGMCYVNIQTAIPRNFLYKSKRLDSFTVADFVDYELRMQLWTSSDFEGIRALQFSLVDNCILVDCGLLSIHHLVQF